MTLSIAQLCLTCLIAGLFHNDEVAALSPAGTQATELRSDGTLVRRDTTASAHATSEELQWPKVATLFNEQHLPLPDDNEVRSNGGGPIEKVFLPGTGVFLRKAGSGSDSTTIMMEALVNDLYEAAGAKAPTCRYYPVTGKTPLPYSLCRFMDDLKPVEEFDKVASYHASINFVLDAVLANYDMWLTRGNMRQDSAGKIVRTDNSGSLAATAAGEWKSTVYNCSSPIGERRLAWSPEPFSLWDMRGPYAATSSAASVKDIEGEGMALWRKKDLLFETIDKFNSTIATQKVKKILGQRLDCLERIVRPTRLSLLGILPTSDAMPKEVCEGVRSLCQDILDGTVAQPPANI